jgi:hypothetical protein
MNKIINILLFVLVVQTFSAQVGIGTNTPDNSAMLDVSSTEKGMLFPRMTAAQRVAIPNPAVGLHIFDINSNSLWFYNGSFWVNYAAQSKYGDVKSGIQTLDHDGWVLLDGRAINTLSATQQAVIASLGLSTNLPNASNAYLSQNGAAMGSVAGANSTTLTQANLPNVNFTGTAATAGGHSHTVDPSPINSSNSGSHSHFVSSQNVSTTSYTHNHGVGDGNNPNNNVPSNVSGLLRRTNSGEALTTNGLDNIFSGEEPDLRNPPKAIPNDTHSHSVFIPGQTTSQDGLHFHTVDVPETTSSTNGAHTHSVSVASGGSASPINIAPQTLTVNMFIYLGL